MTHKALYVIFFKLKENSLLFFVLRIVVWIVNAVIAICITVRTFANGWFSFCKSFSLTKARLFYLSFFFFFLVLSCHSYFRSISTIKGELLPKLVRLQFKNANSKHKSTVPEIPKDRYASAFL
jgi:hypothetical protein